MGCVCDVCMLVIKLCYWGNHSNGGCMNKLEESDKSLLMTWGLRCRFTENFCGR